MEEKTLVSFNDMKYERPNLEKITKEYAELTTQFKNATSARQQIEVIGKQQKLKSHIETMGTLCSIRHSIDTRDAFYEEETNFFDEKGPEFEKLSNEFTKVFVASKFRSELEKEYGKHIFNMMDLKLKVFDPCIMEDLVIENKLSTKYDKLVASAQIEFRGKTYTLSQLSPYLQDIDRQTRIEANKASWGFFAEHEEAFDEIYDELVKVRTKIAKKLGYKNFVQLAYDRMLRSDYGPEEVKQYRKQILQSVVPLASKLKMRQQKRLGLDKMYYYDTALKYTTGNATPKGTPDEIIRNAKRMYKELSPETDEFFTMMTDYQLMDVLSKPGKQAGGYCTTISDYKVPFIFANFNKTQHDVEVMTHEAGHAFQSYQSRNAKLLEYVWPTYEACEIHSMSMEFFTWRWMELFFKEQTDKFKFTHLSGAISFLPYGVTVDEFQHFVYENPTASPAERKKAWREIEAKYEPGIDYADNDFLQRGGFWFRQGHIFGVPFYYIDYTLAQVCALQFWMKLQADPKSAWEDYLRLCKAGGSESFLRLVDIAGLKNPFQDGCLASVIPQIETWLDGIDDMHL